MYIIGVRQELKTGKKINEEGGTRTLRCNTIRIYGL
jgi:hypothetical protein